MHSEYFKHQTSLYNNIIKKGALNGILKKRPSDLLYRLLWGPKILREEKKAINLNAEFRFENKQKLTEVRPK